MKCFVCHFDNDKVIDTRPSEDGFIIRRRRECCNCGKRFTTYERAEVTRVKVIKKDGTRVPFDRDRLFRGLEVACWKRPVSYDQIVSLIARVEGEIESAFEFEVNSAFIGERVMTYLREIDQVAYVRFASVYRHFEAPDDFRQEVNKMLNSENDDCGLDSSVIINPRFPKKKK
ncbi:MAG: transcriptional regulator NrdR [Planctomycetaceae bacterium]|nr:transcriptional regulator NrdR [Planctomycetaceae bacterium]